MLGKEYEASRNKLLAEYNTKSTVLANKFMWLVQLSSWSVVTASMLTVRKSTTVINLNVRKLVKCPLIEVAIA